MLLLEEMEEESIWSERSHYLDGQAGLSEHWHHSTQAQGENGEAGD